MLFEIEEHAQMRMYDLGDRGIPAGIDQKDIKAFGLRIDWPVLALNRKSISGLAGLGNDIL